MLIKLDFQGFFVVSTVWTKGEDVKPIMLVKSFVKEMVN